MQQSDEDLHDGSGFGGLGRPEIAAEFLRRNQCFRDDQARIARRVAMGELSAEDAYSELAQHWGVSFRRSQSGPGWAAYLAT